MLPAALFICHHRCSPAMVCGTQTKKAAHRRFLYVLSTQGLLKGALRNLILLLLCC